MNYRLPVAFVICLVITASLMGAVPVFNNTPTQLSVRLMDYLMMSGRATDADSGHVLLYEWAIASDPTDRAYFMPTPGKTTASGNGLVTVQMAFPWAGASDTLNQGYIGQVVMVDLTVKHADPANDPVEGPVSATRRYAITISGINHPPVPRITGQLGTATSRVPAGNSVVCNAGESTDPDENDMFRKDWGLGGNTGGSYLGGIVMFGSEGSIMTFTVPDMTSPIEQEIMLALTDGMHRVVGRATAYLAPAGGGNPTTNSAPTVTVTSPVSKNLGETIPLIGVVTDLNGDLCDFDWIPLQGGTTVSGSSIVVTPLTAPTGKKWRVDASLGPLPAGSYQFRLQATEISTTDHKTGSAIVSVTVVQGGGGPGYYQETVDACTGNAPPTISMSPNPANTNLTYKGGQVVTIDVSGQDTTPVTTAFGTKTGALISWNLTQLGVTGVSNPTNLVDPNDKTRSTSRLTFTAPDEDREARVTLNVKDMANCAKAITFSITFQKNSTTENQPPVSVIRYKIATGTLQPAPGSPVSVETTPATITLDGTGSTDDGGTNNLAFTWTKTQSLTSGSVTLANAGTNTATLTVASGAQGSLTLNLRVQDQGGLDHTTSISFNIGGAAGVPVAKIKYKIGNGTLQLAPGSPVAVDSPAAITLDGTTSTDDGGAANLTYTWTKSDSLSGGGVTLANANTNTATLTIANATLGSVTVSLKVQDQSSLNNTASITFNISNPAAKPTAKVTIKVGETVLMSPVEDGSVVTLDASESTNSEGTKANLSYSWRQISGPQVSLMGLDASKASFVAPAVEADGALLTFELTVTDTSVSLSATDEGTVTINIPASYFAQIGVGSLGDTELRTVLLLVNNTSTPAKDIVVDFFNEEGQPLNPEINGEVWDQAPFDIQAVSSKRLEFSSSEPDVEVGWARVKATTKLTGLVLFQIVGSEEKDVRREISVFSSSRGRNFATYFNASEETALAVANPGDQPARINVKLIDYVNDEQWVVKDVGLFPEIPLGKLAPKQHRAKFIDADLFGQLPINFKEGTLVVESDAEIIVTVLKTKQGVAFSTLPLATK